MRLKTECLKDSRREGVKKEIKEIEYEIITIAMNMAYKKWWKPCLVERIQIKFLAEKMFKIREENYYKKAKQL